MENTAGYGEKVRNFIKKPSKTIRSRSSAERGMEGEYTLLLLSLVCIVTLPIILPVVKSQPTVKQPLMKAVATLVSPNLTDCECVELSYGKNKDTSELDIEWELDSLTDNDTKERTKIGCGMRKEKKVGEENPARNGRGHGGRGRGQTSGAGNGEQEGRGHGTGNNGGGGSHPKYGGG